MSGLAELRGHLELRPALAAAVLEGRLPAALLLTGPPGVGKQRLGLWLAQLLLCEAPSLDGPCGQCHPCRLCHRIEHPDVHWFFPLPRPKSASGDKLGEALEEARAAELEARRADPWWMSDPGEITGIYLAHAQIIRRLAASRPAMAKRKVFIIGDAELLVPQEASPEAANALLKLLEEPPADTTIIVTAADPAALLPTVRSRLRQMRVLPLSDEEVETFLREVRGLKAKEARQVARLAAGSIGRALGFLGDDEPGPLEAARRHARRMLEAALAPSPVQRYTAALAEAPAGARGSYATAIEFLILWLRDLAAAAAGATEAIINIEATDWLLEKARALPRPDAALDALAEAEEALRLTQFNINPQLGTNELLHRLHRKLAAPSAAGRRLTVPGD